MRKCCTCGKRFNLLAKNRYEVVVKPAGLECLTKGTTYFNAFDCPRCGCQNIVGIVEKGQEDTGAIEKIRAEIDQYLYDEGFCEAYRNDVGHIIDKHLKGGTEE